MERLGEESLEVLTARGGDRPRVRPRAAVGGARDRREPRCWITSRRRSPPRCWPSPQSGSGSFRFAHALINQTLYEGLGATRRARMHQRVAQALEQLYGAGPRRAPRRARAALAAGRRLGRQGQGSRLRAQSRTARAGEPRPGRGGEAVRRRRRAHGDRRQPRALRGADRARRGAAPDRRRRATARRCCEASRIASELGDAELAARAALANSRGYSSVIGEVDEERLAAIERAIELDDPPHPARRARLLALQAHGAAAGDPDFAATLGARRGGDRARPRATGETTTLAECFAAGVLRLWSARDARAARTRSPRSSPTAQPTLQDPALAVLGARRSSYTSASNGATRPRRGARWSALQQIAEELGQPTLRWFATFHARRAGAPARRSGGRRAARRARVPDRTGGRRARRCPDLRRPACLRHPGYQGRGEEIIAMIEQSVERLARHRRPCAPASLGPCAGSTVAQRPRAILEQAASDRFEHVLPDVDELDGAGALRRRRGADRRHRRRRDPATSSSSRAPIRSTGTARTGYGHARM